MKVVYDSRTETMTVVLKEQAVIAESDEGRPGIILDYDPEGDLVSLETLDASRRVTDARRGRVTDARRVQFEEVGS